MKISHFPVAILSCLILLSACGSGPHIEKVEKTSSALGSSKNPIALVEVRKVNTEGAYGASIDSGQTRTWENRYCTGFLLENGNLITGSECLKVGGNGAAAAAENVKVYFRNSNEIHTSGFSVRKVKIFSDEQRGFSILEMEEPKKLNLIYGFVVMAEEIPALDKLVGNLSGTALRMSSLNKSNIAQLEVIELPVLTNSRVEALRNSIASRLNKNVAKVPPATPGNPPTLPKPQDPKDGASEALAAQVQAALVSEYQQGFKGAMFMPTQAPPKTLEVSEGAPIFIDGICYGVLARKPTSNPDGSAVSNKKNTDPGYRVQWLVGEQNLITSKVEGK